MCMELRKQTQEFYNKYIVNNYAITNKIKNWDYTDVVVGECVVSIILHESEYFHKIIFPISWLWNESEFNVDRVLVV